MGELASDKNLNQGVALSSVDWRPAEGWHGFVRPDFSAMFIEGETACGKHMTEEALLSSSAAAVTLCSLLPGTFLSSFVSGSLPCPTSPSLLFSFRRILLFEYLPTVCNCTMCLPGAQGDQETGSDPRELELRTVVCYCVSAGN